MSPAGFEAGVIAIEWLPERAYSVGGRPGLVYPARITRLGASGSLKRDLVNAALIGIVVEHQPEGLAKIVGVESNCTMSLIEGALIGLLLVPVEP